MSKEIGTVEQALRDLKEGKVILVIDDPERENEGDLICAAEFATTENVNMMARDAKGLICMPMDGDTCDALGLEQMVSATPWGWSRWSASTLTTTARRSPYRSTT